MITIDVYTPRYGIDKYVLRMNGWNRPHVINGVEYYSKIPQPLIVAKHIWRKCGVYKERAITIYVGNIGLMSFVKSRS